MEGERFQLRWNDFHANISKNFRDLRYHTEFQDVTLFVDKEHTVSAHKVILSSSSPYFHEVLSNLPPGASPHPVVIMPKDVAYEELVMILDYMYHGEVSLPAEQIQRFLDVANMFKVRGLDETETTTSSSNSSSSGNNSSNSSIGQAVSKTGQVQDHKRSRRPSQAMKSVGLLCPQCNLMCRDVEILKGHIAEFHSKKQERNNPSIFPCDVCDNSFNSSANLETHMRTMHETGGAPRPVGSVAPSIVRPPSRTPTIPVPHKAPKGRPRIPIEKPVSHPAPAPHSHPAPAPPSHSAPAPASAAPVQAPPALHQGKRRRRDDVATTLSHRLGAGVSISTVVPEQQRQQQPEVKEEPQEQEEEQEEMYYEEEEQKYAESQEDYMNEEETYEGDEEAYQEEEEGYPGYDYYGQA